MNEHCKEKTSEIAYATAKGLIASVPFIGSVAAELIGVAIPNKRLERIEQMLNRFAEKVKNIEESVLHQRMREPAFEELFEQGVFEAAKTNARTKLSAISSVLASGVTPEANIAYIKRILDVCAKLDELDLVIIVTLFERYFKTSISEVDSQKFALKNEFNYECSEYDLDAHMIGYITAQWFGIPQEQYDVASETHWLCFSATESSISRLMSENLLQLSTEKSKDLHRSFYEITLFAESLVEHITR